MKIRLLTADDCQVWKKIRLEALQNSPKNFGSSYEEECDWPEIGKMLKVYKVFSLLMLCSM